MGLEKENPLASSNQAVCSVSRQRCSIQIQLPLDVGEKALVLIYNGSVLFLVVTAKELAAKELAAQTHLMIMILKQLSSYT